MSEEKDYYGSEYWKMGLFYANSENPKIFVKKRIGFGYTMNFAKWQSWLIMGLGIILVVGLQIILRMK